MTHAQACVSKKAAEELDALIKATCGSLKSVKRHEEEEGETGADAPPMDPKKSIKQATVTCLERGKAFKILNKRRLKEHDQTPKAYRAKRGFKARQPLAARKAKTK